MSAIIFFRYLGFGISLAGLIAAGFLVIYFRQLSWRVLPPLSWIISASLFYIADILHRGGVLDMPFMPLWSVLLGVHAAALFTGWFVLKCLDELRFRSK